MSRTPIILNFDLQKARDNPRLHGPDGSVAIGTIPAGTAIWSAHFAFERGKPVFTVIGDQSTVE